MVSWLPKLFLLAQDTNTVKSLSTRAWVARALTCMKVLRPKTSAVPWSLNTPWQIASCLCGFVLALWLVRPSPHQCFLWEAVHDPVPVSITTCACHSLQPCLPRRLCPVYLRIPSTHHIVNLPLFVEWRTPSIWSIPPSSGLIQSMQVHQPPRQDTYMWSVHLARWESVSLRQIIHSKDLHQLENNRWTKAFLSILVKRHCTAGQRLTKEFMAP